ncbi:uncharacterized protein LOC114580368 [Dendrobium catenatum]|uniref:uncharacterized protein LOC114580368 n=1 Tax=Dendrobium catenatum TaxID=906689 RepID=UPI0010A00E86|nr:uncharacterized protein LOC114580368 [Dendrobium catenatum]
MFMRSQEESGYSWYKLSHQIGIRDSLASWQGIQWQKETLVQLLVKTGVLKPCGLNTPKCAAFKLNSRRLFDQITRTDDDDESCMYGFFFFLLSTLRSLKVTILQ